MDTAVPNPRKIAKDAAPWYDFSAALGKLSDLAATRGEVLQTQAEDRARKAEEERRAAARERMRRNREATRQDAPSLERRSA